MRKILTVILVAAFALPFVVTSCKKGENDPFMSLKSRTARLCTTWKATEMTQTETANYENWQGDAITTTSTSTLSNGKLITVDVYTQAGTSTTTDDTVTYSIEVTFDKAGTFEQTETSADAGSGWSTSSTTVTKGVWYWAGKNNEIETKNKEVIVMEVTEVVSTSSSTWGGVTTTTTDTDKYTGTKSSIMNMKIDQLKSKEMIVIGEGTYDDVDVDDPYTSSSTFTMTLTSE